ncbi:MAG: aspartyl protease family protein [Bacteroidota bacterium]
MLTQLLSITLTLFLLTHYPTQPLSSNEERITELPFEWVKGKIVIPVSINGQSYKFFLDTGGKLDISPKLQREFAFPIVDEIEVIGINKNPVTLQSVDIPEIKVGTMTFKNRKATISPLYEKYPTSCYGYDGMIGRDFLKGKLLQIDAQKKRVIISKDRSLVEVEGHPRTKLSIGPGGLPRVAVQLNGKKEDIVFDSGARSLFSYKRKTAKKLKIKNKDHKLRFTGIFSFGVSMALPDSKTHYAVKVDQLDIAGHSLQNFYSNISKESRSRLGSKLLKFGTVTIDYQKNWFYFAPYVDQQMEQHYATFGFDFMKYDGQFLIKWVQEGSEAKRQGLKYGDRINKVNGIAVNELMDECSNYINGYSFMKKDRIELEITDSKQQKRSIVLDKIIFK